MERVVSSSERAKSHRSAVGCWIGGDGEEEAEEAEGAARVEADLFSSLLSRGGGCGSVEGCGDGRAEEAKPLLLLLLLPELQSKPRR